jgi:hypothetical protein
MRKLRLATVFPPVAKQNRNRDFHGVSYLLKAQDRDVPLSPLHRAYVCAMKPGVERQFLLRPAFGKPVVPDCIADITQDLRLFRSSIHA